MARPSELVPGNCYFMLGYWDPDLLVPGITTLRYLGEDRSEPERMWRFEPDNGGEDEGGSELVLSDSQLHGVLDLPQLIAGLQQLTRLHPLKPLAPRSPPIAPDAPELKTIGSAIARLASDSSLSSVTITIQFTDDGFSVGRDPDGGMHATFFTHPWLDPSEEEKILAFLGRLGARARVDYRADKGRTRVLEFSLPRDTVAVAEICVGLLTEVYAMRAEDVLVYSWLPRQA